MFSIVHYNRVNPSNLTEQQWAAMQQVAKTATMHAVNGSDITQEHINALTHTGDPGAFQRSIAEPNSRVGQNGINPNQEFRDPEVILANGPNGELVGYALRMINISGRFKWMRDIKAGPIGAVLQHVLGHGGTYTEIDIKVDPEHDAQHSSGRLWFHLGQMALQGEQPDQPVVIYPLAAEANDIARFQKVGFAETNQAKQPDIFGDGTSAVVVRLQGVASVVTQRLSQEISAPTN